MDIDVEHDGLRTKVTSPETPAQSGAPAPPMAQADGATMGPEGAGSGSAEVDIDKPNSLGGIHSDQVLYFKQTYVRFMSFVECF